VDTVTDPRGWITRFRYDRNGRRTQTVTPSGATTSYTYDKHGALSKVTDPRGGATAYTYDKAGRLTKVNRRQGRVHHLTATTRPAARTSIHRPAGLRPAAPSNDHGRWNRSAISSYL